MKSMDWVNDFKAIMLNLQDKREPFKLLSFFSNCKQLPKNNFDFLSRFPDIQLQTIVSNQLEFIDHVKQGDYTPMKRGTKTLRQFYDESLNDPNVYKTLKCYEDLIPSEFIDEFNSLVTVNLLKSETNNFHLPDFYYRFFYGLKYHETEPHFDWSAFQGILLQLYGKKEILLFAPETFPKLPFVYNYINLSYDALETYANIHNIPYTKVTIEDGEGLYIPSYYAHAVKYLTDSSSVSLRLLPRKSHEAVHRHLPANYLLAMILSKQTNTETIEKLVDLRTYTELIEAYERLAKSLLGHIPSQDPASLKYESFMLAKRRSFEHQIHEKNRKNELMKRGAAFFSSL